MAEFSLLIPFDTDNMDFARGFEAGRLWTMMENDMGPLDGQMIHASNAEMVIRMAEALNAPVEAEFTDDENWMVLRVF